MINNDEDDLNTFGPQDEEATNTSTKGKSGKGKAEGGAGSGGLSKLLPHQLKEVMANWEHLDASKALGRLAEFFSEGVARASATLKVEFVSLKSATKHGFTMMHDVLAVGADLGQFARERTRDGMRMVQKRLAKRGLRLNVKPNPTAG